MSTILVKVYSNAVHLSFAPPALVLFNVTVPAVDAVPVPLVIFVLALVRFPTQGQLNHVAMLYAISKRAKVLAPIHTDVGAKSVHFIVLPRTIVLSSCGPFILATAVFLPV